MAHQFDSWDSYFYPETYDPSMGVGVLRNKGDYRTFDALESYDYRMSFARRTELELNPQIIPRTFDAQHVRAIHAQLFQDVYDWASNRTAA